MTTEALITQAPTILVVEDNAINQKVATAVLRRLGYRSEVVEDGRQALERLRQGGAFALVLMDWHMPNMNGCEATERIRALDGEVARVPIVAMTARAMSGDREKCLAAGMDDYLTKPIRKEQLRRVLERWAPLP